MIKLTINLSFYNQNKVLVDQVESWKSWTKDIRDQFSFCIADDCSKVSAMEALKNVDMSDIDLSVYRVNEDLYCNIAGVRNLSAQECKTEWMVILDMDTFVSEELATSMLKLASRRTGEAYKFNRRVADPKHPKNGQPHPAVCLLRVEDYWNVGGCEEDLVGHYGWTDPSFWYRSVGKLHVVTFSDLYMDYCPEGEADIDRDNSHNYKLHEEKKRTGDWSTDFVRFEWKKVY